jgi:membrane protease subunit HflC
MIRSRFTLIIVLAVVALVLLSQTLFVVDQREQAVVVNLGNPVRVVNPPGANGAGLNAKIPFAEQVIRFDRRNIALTSQQEEILTADRQRLVVDAFVRYRIADPLSFYRTLRDERTAEDRIERLVNSSLRQVLGSATQQEIIAGRRGQLMQLTRNDVAQRARASRLGIEVIDVRIKRADFPQTNEEAVYRRMQTDRQQEAARIRAVGEQQKRELMAEADREVTITLAQAQETGETTRGQGDAQRTRILADAYGKDAGFAAFYRSMQAYEASLGQGDTTMVLSPDSAFFRYFEQGPSGGRR